jgi:hypothetical protein
MMMNWKGFGRKRSWPKFKVLHRYSPGVTEKQRKTKNSIRIGGSRGRDSNPELPKYEAEVLTTRPRLSISFIISLTQYLPLGFGLLEFWVIEDDILPGYSAT